MNNAFAMQEQVPLSYRLLHWPLAAVHMVLDFALRYAVHRRWGLLPSAMLYADQGNVPLAEVQLRRAADAGYGAAQMMPSRLQLSSNSSPARTISRPATAHRIPVSFREQPHRTRHPCSRPTAGVENRRRRCAHLANGCRIVVEAVLDQRQILVEPEIAGSLCYRLFSLRSGPKASDSHPDQLA